MATNPPKLNPVAKSNWSIKWEATKAKGTAFKDKTVKVVTSNKFLIALVVIGIIGALTAGVGATAMFGHFHQLNVLSHYAIAMIAAGGATAALGTICLAILLKRLVESRKKTVEKPNDEKPLLKDIRDAKKIIQKTLDKKKEKIQQQAEATKKDAEGKAAKELQQLESIENLEEAYQDDAFQMYVDQAQKKYRLYQDAILYTSDTQPAIFMVKTGLSEKNRNEWLDYFREQDYTEVRARVADVNE